MKIFIVIGMIVISPIIVFVGWMNMTPGYFQETGPCGCNFEYTKAVNSDDYLYDGMPPLCPAVVCQPSLIDMMKLLSANLDFNR